MSVTRLGLAWEDGVLFAAAVEDRSTIRTAEARPAQAEPLRAEDIAQALADAGITPGPATLALGGDAVAIKAIALPPVPAATQVEILRQDGDRYFLLPEPPRAYGLWDREDGEAWACATSEKLVHELLAALEESGLEVRAVTAAPAVYRDAHELLAADASSDAEGVIRASSDPPLPARYLAAVGAAMADPEREDLPDLMPNDVRERRRRETNRRTALLAAAVALLLAIFAGLWGARQDAQEARLIADLEELRAEAQPVIAMRNELDRITREIVAHRRIVEGSGPVLQLLRELSLALPEDAWLDGLETREEGDVLLTGYARSAGDVLAGLAASPVIEGVRFEGQATRTEAAGRAVESFRLAVRWRGESDASN